MPERARFRLDTPNGLIDLPPGTYLIGRAPECDIQISSRLASRHHARLVVDESGATLEDLGAANGTFVNGSPLRVRRIMQNADFIVIGDVVLEVAIETLRPSEPVGPVRVWEPVRASHPSVPPLPGEVMSPGPGTQHIKTIPAKAYEVLEATVEPFFAEQQLPLAEKVLEGWLLQVLGAVKTGAPREADGDAAALRQAIRLARTLASARWVDYSVEFATVLDRTLGPAEIDALEPAIVCVGVSGRLLDEYLTRLRALPPSREALSTLARLERWRGYAAPR